jgi:hypothetical protein
MSEMDVLILWTTVCACEGGIPSLPLERTSVGILTINCLYLHIKGNTYLSTLWWQKSERKSEKENLLQNYPFGFSEIPNDNPLWQYPICGENSDSVPYIGLDLIVKNPVAVGLGCAILSAISNSFLVNKWIFAMSDIMLAATDQEPNVFR